MDAAAPPSTSPPIAQQLAALGRDIKLAHTVFALPFALWAMVLAAAAGSGVGRMPRFGEAALVLLCMVTARTVAMVVNRLADARFDAQNPRTQHRAIPAGRLSPKVAWLTVVACAAAFVLATLGFALAYGNPWPAALSPLVLLFIAGYSLTKRFTWLCHVYLGVALALSPLAAAIAIGPGYLAQPTVWLLVGFVAAWVAGFDVLYALADAEVDRKLGLHAIPARFGTRGALWIARVLHALAAATLIAAVWVSPQLRMLTAIAAGVVVGLLLLEHLLVHRAVRGTVDQAGTPHRPLLHHAFFTVNGIVSLLLGVAGMTDAWLSLQA